MIEESKEQVFEHDELLEMPSIKGGPVDPLARFTTLLKIVLGEENEYVKAGNEVSHPLY